METLVEAMARLRAEGYDLDLVAVAGGRLRCGGCGEEVAAADMVIDELVRFEGESNPDDEAILLAVTTPAGHKGLYSAAYGSGATPDDVSVLRNLPAR